MAIRSFNNGLTKREINLCACADLYHSEMLFGVIDRGANIAFVYFYFLYLQLNQLFATHPDGNTCQPKTTSFYRFVRCGVH